MGTADIPALVTGIKARAIPTLRSVISRAIYVWVAASVMWLSSQVERLSSRIPPRISQNGPTLEYSLPTTGDNTAMTMEPGSSTNAVFSGVDCWISCRNTGIRNVPE
ncbi:hypothetical protein D3C73_1406060 [compost metagenome]